MRTFFARKMRQAAERMVVLPVPGPPVRMENFEVSAERTPCACAGANANPALSCAHATALSTRIGGSDDVPRKIRETARAMRRSAFHRSGN